MYIDDEFNKSRIIDTILEISQEREELEKKIEENTKLLLLILILLFLCRGVSPGKILEHSVLLRLSADYEGWQSPGLGSADGVSALPGQTANL